MIHMNFQALISKKILKTMQKQKYMPVTVENGAIQVHVIYRFIKHVYLHLHFLISK